MSEIQLCARHKPEHRCRNQHVILDVMGDCIFKSFGFDGKQIGQGACVLKFAFRAENGDLWFQE